MPNIEFFLLNLINMIRPNKEAISKKQKDLYKQFNTPLR